MPHHEEVRVVPYTPEQMFELVADVDRYPDFLPWCIAARIRSREPTELVADLVIGFRMVKERFRSRVTLDRPRTITVEYIEGPMKYLTNAWEFRDHPEGCEIQFYVEFEFRSKVLQSLIGVLFHEAVRRMVGAFYARAHALYGRDGLVERGT